MDASTLKNILEAGLLVAGRTLSLAQLEALFQHDDEKPERKEIREALESLKEDYNGRGIELVEVASGFRLQSHESVSDWVANLFQEKTPRYSRALLETLVLIAYRQPITRAEIEEVRGVAVSSNIIKTLQERQWVKVLGHKEVPGRPALLGTTKDFLDYFNLKKLDELPSLADIKDLDQFDELLAEEIGEVDEQGDAANDDGDEDGGGDSNTGNPNAGGSNSGQSNGVAAGVAAGGVAQDSTDVDLGSAGVDNVDLAGADDNDNGSDNATDSGSQKEDDAESHINLDVDAKLAGDAEDNLDADTNSVNDAGANDSQEVDATSDDDAEADENLDVDAKSDDDVEDDDNQEVDATSDDDAETDENLELDAKSDDDVEADENLDADAKSSESVGDDEEGAPEHNETLSGPELELLRVISDFSEEHQHEVDARDEMEAGILSKDNDLDDANVADLSQRIGDDSSAGDMPEPGDTLH